MNVRTLVICTALCGSILFCIRERMRLNDRRNELDDASASVVSLRARVDAASKKSDSERARATVGKKEATPPPATQPLLRPVPGIRGSFAYVLADEELKTSFLSAYKLNLRPNFYPLFVQLALTPDQMDTFSALMSDYIEGRAKQLPMEQLDAERKVKLERLLGPGGFEQFQEFRNTYFERETAIDLATLLSGTPAPLTASQSNQVTALLASARLIPKLVQGATVYPTQAEFDEVRNRASAFLLPEQLRAFDKLLSATQGQQTLDNTARRTGPYVPSR